ncbi:hypothetical protein Flav3CDRAFT_0984 [Flavobacteria bacterium MS024-3C]|nr:hypothetical protein Flav3CDRAFT_0984 [Flavobacteria bacterium MS024-3C]
MLFLGAFTRKYRGLPCGKTREQLYTKMTHFILNNL